MALPWRGYFINLDRSADRRAAMERRLEQAGLAADYRRFAAVGGEGRPAACRLLPGQYGCFRSHHDLLASLPPDGRPLHVIEDDCVIAPEFVSAVPSVIAGKAMDPFDIVFTETMIGPDVGLLRFLKSLFDRSGGSGRPLTLSLLDLKTMDFCGMTSYFVSPAGKGRVAECLQRGLAAGPARPVDIYLRDEVRAGRLKAGLLFPFVTSIDLPAGSTVAPESPSGAVSLLLRNSFFVGRDLAASRRGLDAVLASLGPAAPDPHLDLIADMLRFYASDRFKPF